VFAGRFRCSGWACRARLRGVATKVATRGSACTSCTSCGTAGRGAHGAARAERRGAVRSTFACALDRSEVPCICGTEPASVRRSDHRCFRSALGGRARTRILVRGGACRVGNQFDRTDLRQAARKVRPEQIGDSAVERTQTRVRKIGAAGVTSALFTIGVRPSEAQACFEHGCELCNSCTSGCSGYSCSWPTGSEP
jgi:hypothetical protein